MLGEQKDSTNTVSTLMTKLRIVGILPVYNEADIVDQSIAHMTKQGIRLVVIDNGSTDGSLAIERKFLGKGVLEVRVVPPDPYYDLKQVLSEGYDLSLKYSPDWLVHVNADEFIESPYPHLTLAKAIENEARLGYNMIQVNVFDFHLTERDHQSKVRDVRKRLRYYTWITDFHYRAWKHYPGTDLLAYAGHKPVFPPDVKERVSPFKFPLRHYKFRSLEQGMRKVFNERLPRYDPKNRSLGWHVQYSTFKPDPNYFIIDSRKLNRYNEDGRWNLERVFDSFFGGWTPPNIEDHLPPRELVKFKFKIKIKQISDKVEALSQGVGEISSMQNVIYQRSDPIFTLLGVYYARKDLQDAFPEVRIGEYSDLVRWAASSGVTEDPARETLAKHKSWYQSPAYRSPAGRVYLFFRKISIRKSSKRRRPSGLMGQISKKQ